MIPKAQRESQGTVLCIGSSADEAWYLQEEVQAAIKLIDDEKWRAHCRSIAANADLDTAFFKGDSSLFRKAMEDLIWPPKG